jgi:mannose-6-phosphate isomerase
MGQQARGTAVDDRRQDILLDERPWGSFRQYCLNEPTTVKLISVHQGGTLSLQRHRQRDELWIVLDDGLIVEIEGERYEAVAGDEFFIPKGTIHRVSAPDRDARFVEVAFGAFDEDDIERLEDRYGRS